MLGTSTTVERLVAFVAAHGGLVAQAFALALGLVLLALVVRRTARPIGPHVALDVTHIVFRAAFVLPITALVLGALDASVTRWAPWMRVDLLGALPLPLQFVAWVVLVDLVDYGVHRLFHAVPWLWSLHAIHHSQAFVNPLTTTRTHPVELVIKRVLTWAPLVILGGPDQPWPLWIALDGFWGFFVHSGLPITLGPLGWVIVSPAFHTVHHSSAREHRDTNFGERLSVWDTLFRTARRDVREPIATGIDDATFPIEHDARPMAITRTWLAQFFYPFRGDRPLPSLRRVLGGLLRVLVGIVLAVVIAEVFLRAFTEERPLFYDFDEELGWAPTPGAHGRQHDEGDAEIQINASGFRDRDHPRVAAEGTLRIAVLGDSYTDAIQVPVDTTWWRVLEHELATCPALSSRQVEVLDFGVRGYGTAQELLTWRRAARGYHPNLVVLLYTPENDLVENSRALSAKSSIAPFFLEEDGALVLHPPTDGATLLGIPQLALIRAAFVLRRHSRVAAAIDVEAIWRRVRNGERARFGFRAADDPELERLVTYAQSYASPDEPALRDAWHVTDGLLEMLTREVRSEGATAWWVSGSSPIQAYPDRARREDFAERLGVPDLLASEHHLEALATRLDVPYLALAPVLAHEADASDSYLHGFTAGWGVGHWNEAGHRVAGRAIAERLCASLSEPAP